MRDRHAGDERTTSSQGRGRTLLSHLAFSRSY